MFVSAAFCGTELHPYFDYVTGQRYGVQWVWDDLSVPFLLEALAGLESPEGRLYLGRRLLHLRVAEVDICGNLALLAIDLGLAAATDRCHQQQPSRIKGGIHYSINLLTYSSATGGCCGCGVQQVGVVDLLRAADTAAPRAALSAAATAVRLGVVVGRGEALRVLLLVVPEHGLKYHVGR